MADNTQNILILNHIEAKDFFLKTEHYSSIDIPNYFDFTELINKLYVEIAKDNITNLCVKTKENTSTYCKTNAKKIENINHEILVNKNINSWRKFTVINPLLYSYLIYEITKLENWDVIVKKLLENINVVSNNINCKSIPILNEGKKLKDKGEQIKYWYKEIEQASLKMALEFNYITHTDITNCYPSIYTHSIAWALHGKKVSQDDKKQELIGNKIDDILQSISYRQTNGIPQGSTIMDFIAEIVLSEIDKKLFEKIQEITNQTKQNIDYQILRYRDDYRIFTKNKNDAEIILKNLSDILCKSKFILNENKTITSEDIIKYSIREIKLFFIEKDINKLNNFQDKLLIIKNASNIYQNQGYLSTVLAKININIIDINNIFNYFHIVNYLIINIAQYKCKIYFILCIIIKVLYSIQINYFKYKNLIENKKDEPEILISIITEIAINNPKAYPASAAIISTLLAFMTDKDKKFEIFKNIVDKFKKFPRTSIMELWLQRIFVGLNYSDETNIFFDEKLCKILNEEITINDLFDTSFIEEEKILNIFNTTSIINEKLLAESKQNQVIQQSEFDLFNYDKF